MTHTSTTKFFAFQISLLNKLKINIINAVDLCFNTQEKKLFVAVATHFVSRTEPIYELLVFTDSAEFLAVHIF